MSLHEELRALADEWEGRDAGNSSRTSAYLSAARELRALLDRHADTDEHPTSVSQAWEAWKKNNLAGMVNGDPSSAAVPEGDEVEVFPPGTVVCDKKATDCVFTIGDGGYISHADGEWVEFDPDEHHAWNSDHFARVDLSARPAVPVETLAEVLLPFVRQLCTCLMFGGLPHRGDGTCPTRDYATEAAQAVADALGGAQ